MPDTKITALTALTTADPANDMMPIVDVSDTSMAASGTTKRISINNILACSPSATLASATITGDLTVDTSTLKVDSSNDRVGIGTASPAQFVHLSKSNVSTALTSPPVGGASLRIQNTSSTNNNFGSVEFYNAAGLFGASVNCQHTNQATPTNDLVFVTRGSGGGLEHYRIAADGVATWSEVGGVAGTAMTLNSTGLGVGMSPQYKLQVGSTTYSSIGLNIASVTDTACIFKGTPDAVGYEFAKVFSGRDTSAYTYGSYLAFYTEGKNSGTTDTSIERLRIDSTGQVGIGVTPSAWGSNSKALQVGGGSASVSSTGAGSTASRFAHGAYFDNTNWLYQYPGVGAALYEVTGANAGSTHAWYTSAGGTAGNTITDFATAKMTLDASGNLLVGATSFAVNNGKLRIQHSGLAGEWGIQTKSSTTDGYVGVFYTTTGQAGFISVSGTSTTFSTTSDYRLKESVQPLIGGLARINNLKPSTYKWKADGSNSEGFIAHELAEVVPAAVTGQKDAVNADGSIKPQGVDLSKLVPILVAAIQELTARVQTLEAK